MLKTSTALFGVIILTALLFVGCGNRWQPNSGTRFAVTCQGPPTSADFLDTQRGDLLINGEKCKFFRPQGKSGKRKKS